jgi:hypothetical protein
MEEKIVSPITNTTIPQAVPPQTIVEEVNVVPLAEKEEVPSKPSAETVIKSTIPYQIDPLFHEVADYFGVDQKDWDTAKTKLGTIVDYVAEAVKSGDAGDIMLKLREIEDTIQKPAWDEKRYTNVYRFVRLAQQRSSVDKAMSALQRGGF